MTTTPDLPPATSQRLVYPRDAYSPWWRRVVAALVDNGALIALYVAAMAVEPPLEDPNATGARITALLLSVTYIALFIANILILQGRTGASIGQRLVGIELLDEYTGQPIGILRNFLRRCMHIVDTLSLGVGWLWPLWDHKRQTFADKIMGTVVVPRPGRLR